MTAFLIRRTGQSVIVVFGVTLFTFILTRIIPGGAARATLGPRATPQQIADFNQANGYNLPGVVQYFAYLNQLLHLNLGYSYRFNENVVNLLQDYLPKTLLLLGLAYVVAFAIAIPMGIYQGVRRNSVGDYTFTTLSFVLYSMPIFWLGLILIILFSVTIPILPAQAPQSYSGDIVANVLGLVLPVMTLALITIALFSRYMRSSVLDNVVQDYVRTARAKGASERRVLYGHVLRNSLIPIVTLLGVNLPIIVSGAVIVEALFNYPGMGLLLIDSAVTRDYPVLLGETIVIAIFTVLGNLLADIFYAVVDPRVRLA